MSENRYVVINENILGYIYPEQEDVCWVLRASVIKGASHVGHCHYIGHLDIVRDAKLEDFEEYRVSPTGHLTII